MARSYAKLLTSIWSDKEFVALDEAQQRLYMLLTSQPDLSAAGVLPYLPRRWARLSASTSEADVVAGLRVLEERRFIVIDLETDELLVRTFVVHDGGLTNKNLRTAIGNAMHRIMSPLLRSIVDAQIPAEHRFEMGLEPVPNGVGDASRTASDTASQPEEERSLQLVPDASGVGEGEGVTPNGTSTAVEVVEPAAPKPRPRNELWDAVMDVCGVASEEITPHNRAGYGKAVASIKQAGGTPDQVHVRADVYRRKFEHAALTPHALAKRWPELDPARQPNGHARGLRNEPALRRALARGEQP